VTNGSSPSSGTPPTKFRQIQSSDGVGEAPGSRYERGRRTYKEVSWSPKRQIRIRLCQPNQTPLIDNSLRLTPRTHLRGDWLEGPSSTDLLLIQRPCSRLPANVTTAGRRLDHGFHPNRGRGPQGAQTVSAVPLRRCSTESVPLLP
jgi:hypothetical protein